MARFFEWRVSMSMDEWVLTGGAGRILGCGPDEVRRLERVGILPAVRTSDGVRLFRRADVERVKAERAAVRRRGRR